MLQSHYINYISPNNKLAKYHRSLCNNFTTRYHVSTRQRLDKFWYNFVCTYITLLDTTPSTCLLIIYSRQCCRMENQKFWLVNGKRFFSSRKPPDPVSCFMGIESFFSLGIKGKGCEADHWRGGEVMHECSHTATSPYVSMERCFIKQRGQSAFLWSVLTAWQDR